MALPIQPAQVNPNDLFIRVLVIERRIHAKLLSTTLKASQKQDTFPEIPSPRSLERAGSFDRDTVEKLKKKITSQIDDIREQTQNYLSTLKIFTSHASHAIDLQKRILNYKFSQDTRIEPKRVERLHLLNLEVHSLDLLTQ